MCSSSATGFRPSKDVLGKIEPASSAMQRAIQKMASNTNDTKKLKDAEPAILDLPGVRAVAEPPVRLPAVRAGEQERQVVHAADAEQQ